MIYEEYEMDGIIYEIESITESLETQLYMGEVLFFTEKTNIDLVSIHEDFKSKLKDSINKLFEMIRNLWTKFINKANELMGRDAKFLKDGDNNNIIKNKPLKDDTYEMYPYWKGIQKIKSFKVVPFNFESMKEDLLLSEKDFIKNTYKAYGDADDPYEAAKIDFRGAEKPVKNSPKDLPLQDMQQFCLNYNKQVDDLKAEMKEIEKAGKEAVRQANSIRESVIGNDKYLNLISESMSILLEADDDNNNNGGNTNDNNQKDDNKSNNNNQKDKESSDSSKPKITKSEDSEDKNKESEMTKKYVDGIKMYTKVSTRFVTAEMTVLQEAYNAYMFVLKAHIDSYKEGNNKNQNNNNNQNNKNQNNNNNTEANTSILNAATK